MSAEVESAGSLRPGKEWQPQHVRLGPVKVSVLTFGRSGIEEWRGFDDSKTRVEGFRSGWTMTDARRRAANGKVKR
jgi:hypothetical protein